MGIICVTDKNVGMAQRGQLPSPAILHPKKPHNQNAPLKSTDGSDQPTSKFNSPITTKYALKYHAPVRQKASMYSSVFKGQKYLLCTLVPPEIPFYQTEVQVESNPSLTSFITTVFQERPKKAKNNLLHIVGSSDSFDIGMGEDFRQTDKKGAEFIEAPIPVFLCNLVRSGEGLAEDQFSVHEFKYSWKYTKRELIPVDQSGEIINLEPVKSLDLKELTFYIAETQFYNYKDPLVQRWLQKHELLIRQDEDAIDFLQRVLTAIWTVDCKCNCFHRNSASEVVAGKSNSSIGWATLFVSICRQNGIPSRTHFGYKCEGGDKTKEHKRLLKLGMNPSFVFSEFHSKAEVWIDNLGWIPVELVDKEKGILRADEVPFLTSHFYDFLSMDMRALITRSSTINYSNSVKYEGTNDEISLIYKSPDEEKFDGAIVKLCNDFLMLWQTARRKRSMDLLRQTFAKLTPSLREEFHQECTVFDSVFFQGYDITFLPFKVTSRKTNKDGICHSTIMFTDLQTMEIEEYIISLDIEDDLIADINIASIPYLHEEDKVEERKLKILGSYVRKEFNFYPPVFSFGTHNQSLHTTVKTQVHFWDFHPDEETTPGNEFE